jgi:hypothetical protein
MLDSSYSLGNGKVIKIKIGPIERDIRDTDEDWVKQQVNGRRESGEPVCVRVSIHMDGVNVLLSTADCSQCPASTRPPNCREKPILDLWKKYELSGALFDIGRLLAFIRELSRMVN